MVKNPLFYDKLREWFVPIITMIAFTGCGYVYAYRIAQAETRIARIENTIEQTNETLSKIDKTLGILADRWDREMDNK